MIGVNTLAASGETSQNQNGAIAIDRARFPGSKSPGDRLKVSGRVLDGRSYTTTVRLG